MSTTLLLYNGPIYTLNPAQPQAQALAIRDGRILAVGSLGKVQAAVGSRAEPVDLQGRAAIPALTDAHVHLTWYAVGRREVRLEVAPSVEAAVALAAVRAAALPAGAWVLGGGWDQTAWGGRWPTAADLDADISDRPVMLMRKDGHSAWCNSVALRIAGITDHTADPEGGAIQRHHGTATGVLLENAIELVRAHVPPPSEAERHAALRAVMDEAHGYGMNSVHIPPSLEPGDAALALRDIRMLHERGELALRCLVHFGIDALDETIRLGLRSGIGDTWLKLGAVKMFADGTLGSETAEMLWHYEGRRHTGTQTLSTEAMNDAVARCTANGLAVIIHAIGDGANRRVLDAIAAARAAHPGSSAALPDRVEHCQLLHRTDVPRFAAMNVVASMQPIHCTSDIDTAARLWGEERCQLAYAWRAILDSGATLALGSDAPVEPLNPWLGIHAAVTRQRRNGTPAGGWHPEQCLTVEEAVRGFTHGAAVAAGWQHEFGTLEVGKLADIAILSDDPFRCEPDALQHIHAVQTLIEGR